MILESLNIWCKENNLSLESLLGENVFEFKGLGERFLLVSFKEGKLFDKDLFFILSNEEKSLIEEDEKICNLMYLFGGRFYYTNFDRDQFINEGELKPKFNDLRYIGEPKQQNKTDFAHLGVHSEYELLNGTGLAEDWAKKAKFLGHKSIGIVDKNTLAGVLSFQLSCEKLGIKSIIGATYSVNFSKEGERPELYDFLVYAKNYNGWRNLLRMNKSVNIDNDGFVYKDDFFSYNEGIILVLGKNSNISQETDVNELKKLALFYKKIYKDDVYFQIDSVDYWDENKYKSYANTLSNYLLHYSNIIKPILIGESYYIEKEGAISQLYLNEIKKTRTSSSHDQFYKTLDEHKVSIKNAYDVTNKTKYKNGKTFTETLEESIKNTMVLSNKCDFKIETGLHKIPAFESEKDNEELFFELIEDGMKNKIEQDPNKSKKIQDYVERIDKEATLISGAGFVDYFLILWDIIKNQKDKGNIVGNGRGSVGGSLLAYLLDITTVDPIEHDLMFERFLNPARLAGERAKMADSAPDIDVDFGGVHRDDVKRYMEEKYGKDYVVSVGTFTRLKTKGALKGFCRADGLPFSYVNFISKNIEDNKKPSWGDFFTDSCSSPILKEFIQKYPDIINYMKPVLNQAQTPSVHASAVVIVPKYDREGNPMTVFDWMPVRKISIKKGKESEYVLISEWEGKYIERAGFLKEDILGIAQIDKFEFILKLIEKTTKDKVILENIPLDDPNVYKIFQRGFNEDVFQFGTAGIQRYSRQVLPDTIEDLIAMNALYRPGPMGSKAHDDYALIKHGKKKPEFDFKLRQVTENTYGLYVYQEQIMAAVNVLGGLSLSEADEIRTVMKKFDKVKMKAFKDKFIDGAKKNGCKPHTAELIWAKLEKFSGYGFNKSHSAAYSIMGYWCQWLKCYYPLQFYTAALNFSKHELMVSNILDEITTRDLDMEIFSPDVNKSNASFLCDVKNNVIFWSLSKIKGVGTQTVKAILKERKNGKYSDVNDFVKRLKGTGVGKSTAETLIIAGAFDNTYLLENPRERISVIKELYESSNDLKTFSKKYNNSELNKNYYWTMLQKELTGFGYIDFRNLLTNLDSKASKLFLKAQDFLDCTEKWRPSCIAGRPIFLTERKTKRGIMCSMTLDSNNKLLIVTIWADVWEKYKEQIEKIRKSKNKLLAITGKCLPDDYRGHNVLYSDSELTKVYEL